MPSTSFDLPLTERALLSASPPSKVSGRASVSAPRQSLSLTHECHTRLPLNCLQGKTCHDVSGEGMSPMPATSSPHAIHVFPTLRVQLQPYQTLHVLRRHPSLPVPNTPCPGNTHTHTLTPPRPYTPTHPHTQHTPNMISTRRDTRSAAAAVMAYLPLVQLPAVDAIACHVWHVQARHGTPCQPPSGPPPPAVVPPTPNHTRHALETPTCSNPSCNTGPGIDMEQLL